MLQDSPRKETDQPKCFVILFKDDRGLSFHTVPKYHGVSFAKSKSEATKLAEGIKMLNASSCLEMKKEGSGKTRRRSAGREPLPRNGSHSGPRPAARTFQYRPPSPHVAGTSKARGAEPGTPAHTPTAAAPPRDAPPGQKVSNKNPSTEMHRSRR